LTTEGGLVREIEERLARPWGAVNGLHLMLDEAQKAPLLFQVVKDIHDQHPGKVRFLLTGSSAMEIHDPVAETLAGRARILHLHPFTLAEARAHARGEDPTRDALPTLVSRLLGGRFSRGDFDELHERSRWDAPDRRLFTWNHLRHPLFPEPSSAAEPEEWVRDYLATYVEKDVRSLAAVGNLELFRACVRQVAARTGSPVRWETMAQEIGTTSITLRRYVGLMEQTQTLLRLAPFGVNPVKRVIRSPKVYLADAGLLWGLRGFEDEKLLEASGMLGTYMEQLGIVEIAKWCSLEPTAPELRFWAKTPVSEVDLVVSNRGFHIPVEIKLGRTVDRRWMRGLDAFEEDHRPERLEIPYRVLLHMGEPEMPDARTFAIPLWALS
jgi:predicted AAA+ superfamily ATPase